MKNRLKETLTSLFEIIGNNTTYSTSEKKIGTWVDGKPIYRTTKMVASSISASVDSRYSMGVSNVDTLVSLRGTCYWWGSFRFPIPYTSVNNSQTIQIYWYAGDNQVGIYSLVDINNVFVTMEYTKTTD